MSDQFTTWLATELNAAAAHAPLRAPQPSQALYRRPLTVGQMTWRIARPVIQLSVGFAAVLLVISAQVAHSVNPVTVYEQASASLRQCASDIGNGNASQCGSAFLSPHVNQAPPTPVMPTPIVVPTTTPLPSVTPTGGLFSDQFTQDPTGSPPAGWTVDSGSWIVAADGTNRYLTESGTGDHRIHVTGGQWANIAFTVAVRPTTSTAVGILGVRYQNAQNYIGCAFGNGQLRILQVANGTFTTLASTPVTADSSVAWQVVGVKVVGTNVSCGTLGTHATTITAQVSTTVSGSVGFVASGVVGFDEVTVRPAA